MHFILLLYQTWCKHCRMFNIDIFHCNFRNTHSHTRTNTHMYTSIHKHMYCTYARTHIKHPDTHMHGQIRMHPNIRIHTYARTHTLARARTHTHTYTLARAHTHAQTLEHIEKCWLIGGLSQRKYLFLCLSAHGVCIYVFACPRACMRACVRACVRACEPTRVHIG